SVARLERVFSNTNGNLHALSEVVVKDPAAWAPEQKKMRTPVEYVTAAMRLTNWPRGRECYQQKKQLRRLVSAVRLSGEVPFAAPSPKGWPDTADAWNGSDGMLDRIEWAKNFGEELPESVNAAATAEMGLGPLLRPATKAVMAKASSHGEAIALLIASPE